MFNFFDTNFIIDLSFCRVICDTYFVYVLVVRVSITTWCWLSVNLTSCSSRSQTRQLPRRARAWSAQGVRFWHGENGAIR